MAAQAPCEHFPYRDASQPVAVRVDDLLSRMTLREKVGQLLCLPGWQSYELTATNRPTLSASFLREQDSLCVGSYWAVMRADPWTQRTLAQGLPPPTAALHANALQHYATEQTRLGIPLLLCEEAPHGHMAIGTTVFPTGLGLSATFSAPLLHRVGATIARELRSQGAAVAFGPVADLCRDPRWSRTEETMGEDAYLTGQLAGAIVAGMTADSLYRVAPVLKHFAAYGAGAGGQNGAAISIGPRELRQTHLPPFREAIGQGAQGVMTAYNAIDGIPATANKQLLRTTLREAWGFDGLIFSDLYSINMMHNTLHTASSTEDAARQSLQAGVDVDLGGLAYTTLCAAVKAGGLDERLVDEAVRRVLTLKFELGLFDHPYVDTCSTAERVHTADDVRLARDVARASVTLLKNENKLLPLAATTRVAMVGDLARDVYAQLGDYTAPQPTGKVVTVTDALFQRQGRNYEAHEADVIVAVVGGSSSRYEGASYLATGAAEASRNLNAPHHTQPDSGEGLDRLSLDIPAAQQHMLDSLRQMGKPLVVVYIEGRPLLKNWAAAHADALLTLFYPGEQGGAALADVLFGDYNPAGRLSVSQPRSVGQLPVCYDRPLPLPHDYVDGPAAPLYPFGYGLSYTRFDYSNLAATDTLISVDVTNVGERDGEEVVQLYLRAEAASVVQPAKRLKGFQRVFIPKGQTLTVSFPLRREDFALVGSDLRERVEAGTFRVMVGASSDDIRLTERLHIE